MPTAMRNEESNIQSACVGWFRYRWPAYAGVFFSVPNGGRRDKVTGAVLKREGALAGVSDLLLLVARGGFHGLCIEMKAGKGRQQDSQRRFERNVAGQGYCYVVCRSLEEFMERVDAYMKGRLQPVDVSRS